MMQFMVALIVIAWESTKPLEIKEPLGSYIANNDMLFLIILSAPLSAWTGALLFLMVLRFPEFRN